MARYGCAHNMITTERSPDTDKMKFIKTTRFRWLILAIIILITLVSLLKIKINKVNSQDPVNVEYRERSREATEVDRSHRDRDSNLGGRPNISRLISMLTISDDSSDLEELFKSKPAEVIDALKIQAVENLDPKSSDILGKLILEYYGVKEGADYIDQELKGHAREWTRIGFGAALLLSDRAGFHEYLSRMNLCSARDNLVAMAVVEMGKTDPMGAYHLWEKERDAVGAGTSPAKDMMVSMMVQNLVQQSDPGDLERFIFSDRFFEIGSSEVEQVSLVISQSSPSLALKWAIDRQASQEVRDHIVVDVFKESYETQEGSDKLLERLTDASFNESDAMASISESIRRNTLGDSEGQSFDSLVNQFGWIVKKMPSSGSNHKLQAQLGSALAKQHPLKALEFAATVPPGEGGRGAYIDGVVSVISNGETEPISAMISQIEDDEIRQEVIIKISH